MCGYVHVSASIRRGGRHQIPLELVSQAIVSPLTLSTRIKFRSSARALPLLTCEISFQPYLFGY